ncbi:MAG: 6-phosphogluconolactonase [Rhizobiaceae bacterium]|nr:6-phosphogluconolactonase [Rhizobiaceae bacterium]
MATIDIDLKPSGDRQALAEALARRVAGALAQAVAQRGKGLLAVSGGTTPALFFKTLAEAAIDWSRVTVTLVDERFVPETSPRSNAGLARANLMTGRASAATFVGLYSDAPDVETAAAAASKAVTELGLPLDVAVLGMGGDGHTASFFPDAASLSRLLDPAGREIVAPVHAESGGEPRLTLTLPVLVEARMLALHIEGEAKRTVLDGVLGGDDLPVGRVLKLSARPVEVYWAP